MIDQAIAVERIRAHLQTVAGKPVYLAAVPPDADEPYAILYVLPFALRHTTPLTRDPGAWTAEIQVTSVGKATVQAAWMSHRVDEAMQSIEPPAGVSDVSVRCTVSPLVGSSEQVATIVQRWVVRM